MADLVIETPVETVETIDTGIEETFSETTIAPDTEVAIAENASLATDQESGETEVEIDTAETGTVVDDVPVTFAAELDAPALIEQGKAEVEKYDVPQPLQAYIEALETRASAPQELTEYAVYGDKDAITSSLERQNYLDSIEEVAEGQYRPRTDKFVESIQSDATKVSWLRHDLNKLPSEKYPGLNGFEELIADGLALQGESAQEVIARYNDTIAAMRMGSVIVPDIPAFVPANLQEAYSKLPRDTRDLLANLDVNDESEANIAREQLGQLELIQKGLDADKADAVRESQIRQQQQTAMQSKVLTTQENFWNTYEEGFREKLAANVKFSDNPSIQSLQVEQTIAMLTRIFSPTQDGDAARKALTSAGIKFDGNAPAHFLKDVERAAVSLANAQSLVDAQGQSLDKVAYNKAVKEFEIVGKKILQFGDTVIDQMGRLIITGKTDEIKEAVAKQKIEVKSRPALKGSPSAAVKKEDLPKYGTDDWDKYWATKTLEEQAQKVARYASV